MKPIRFEKPKLKTTYVVNLDQVLWVEFVSGSDLKGIIFHFASEKSLSVTESEMGEEEFKKLKIKTNIEETKTTVRAI